MVVNCMFSQSRLLVEDVLPAGRLPVLLRALCCNPQLVRFSFSCTPGISRVGRAAFYCCTIGPCVVFRLLIVLYRRCGCIVIFLLGASLFPFDTFAAPAPARPARPC